MPIYLPIYFIFSLTIKQNKSVKINKRQNTYHSLFRYYNTLKLFSKNSNILKFFITNCI